MSSGSIFIVHSDKDLNPALEIAQMLKKAGAEVWIESLNLKNLSPTEDEDEIIEKAILSSELVAIITSKHALTDDWVKNQKGLASDNGKNLVLVKVTPCDLTKKLRWRSIPSIDFQSDKDAAINTLLEMAGITPIEVNTNPSEEDSVPAEPERKNVEEASVSESVQKKESASEESALLDELQEDFEYYKFKLSERVKNSKFNKKLGITLAAVLVVLAIIVPEFFQSIEQIRDKIQWAGGMFGGVLPSSFSGLNLNSEKMNKERLRIFQNYERRLNRMLRGQMSYTKDDIFAFEDEVEDFINT